MSPLRFGFTLIELIMVISIIAVITGTVFVGVDPARRLQAARNATRWADITTLLAAVKRYQFDHNGLLPPIDADTVTVQLIGKGEVDCVAVTCDGVQIKDAQCVLSSFPTDLRPYLRSLPQDPKTGSEEDTRYYANKDEYGIVSVGACDEEPEGRAGKGEPPAIEISR